MFRLNQKGVSLPIVLSILALVIANTYYFMDVQKNTKDQNIKRGAEIEDNTEKIRLASFLSDASVCSSINTPPPPAGKENDVFGGKTISQINLAGNNPLKKAGIEFLKTAIPTGPANKPNFQPLYGRGSLKLLHYEIVANPQPALPAPQIPVEKLYYLKVTYTIVDRSDLQNDTGKTKVIRLPLYLVFTAGNPNNVINTCFTEADEGLNTVTNAVSESCKGTTARLVTNGLLECQHEQNDQTCANSEVLVGVKLTDDNPSIGKQEYVCAYPKNAAVTAGIYCSAGELLSDLQINDKFVCSTTDPSCAPGQMFVMVGATIKPNCVQNCAANELFKSVGSSGVPTCIPRPKQCPVGQYTKTISKGGEITCEAYTVLNKTCSAGKVAADIDPTAGASASGDTALGCRVITKDKVCPGTTTETTFVQSLTSVTPACKTF
jgi:hypothetical protein